MTQKAIFSEGRGLRVRVARPCASPGYAMITEGRTNGRWPNREMVRSRAGLSRGRAEPAPPGDCSPELGWPGGESPEMTQKAIFSEGRTLCVSDYRPDASRDIT